MAQNSYESSVDLVGTKYIESRFTESAGVNTLYEYQASNYDNLQRYIPISNTNTSPIIFAIRGTSSTYDVFKNLSLLSDYTSHDSAFSFYESDLNKSRHGALTNL